MSKFLDRLNRALKESGETMSFHARGKLHPASIAPMQEAGQSTKGHSGATTGPTFGSATDDLKPKKKTKNKPKSKGEDNETSAD